MRRIIQILVLLNLMLCANHINANELVLGAEYRRGDSVNICHEFWIKDRIVKVTSSEGSGNATHTILVLNESGEDTLYSSQEPGGLNKYHIFGKENKKILVLDLYHPATRVFNQVCIFDFGKANEPCRQFTMELLYSNDGIPHFKRTMFSGRDEFGTGFYSFYCYKYEDGKFVPEDDYDNVSARNIRPDYEEWDKTFTNQNTSRGINDPLTGSIDTRQFEEVILQFKIYNKESLGWDLFDNHYKSKDKEAVRKVMRVSLEKRFNEFSKPLECK